MGVLAIVLVVGASLSACGASKPGVRIGAIYPRTGPQGLQGTEEARGVALAAQWANDHGGVAGQPIAVVPIDAPRAEAVSTAMTGLRARGIRIVVGSHGSAISAAAAAAATQQNMVFWETGAVGQVAPDVAGGRHFFRMSPMGANLGRAAVAFSIDQLAAKLNLGRGLRFAVALVDDVYGRAVGNGAIDEVSARGAELVGTFPYPARGANYNDLADRIGATKPDVLFVAAYMDDGVALREATIRRGIHLAASIGTSSSYCMPAFGRRLGVGAVGLFASDKPDAADLRPDALQPEGRRALQWVNALYTKRFGEPMSAAALSGFANAYALFVHVLPAAASSAPDAVADAALAVKLPEGTLANGGGMDLVPPGNPDGGANRASAGVIEEWVAVRDRKVVWPAAYATHPVTVLPLL